MKKHQCVGVEGGSVGGVVCEKRMHFDIRLWKCLKEKENQYELNRMSTRRPTHSHTVHISKRRKRILAVRGSARHPFMRRKRSLSFDREDSSGYFQRQSSSHILMRHCGSRILY